MGGAGYSRKFAAAVLCLGFLASGCVKGSPMPKGALPWEYGGDYGKVSTGDYLTVSGPVATFGEAPKAVKPASPETLQPKAQSESPLPRAVPSEAAKSLAASGDLFPAPVPKPAGQEYDFSLSYVSLGLQPGQTSDSRQLGHDVVAFNRGDSPVSIMLSLVNQESQNTRTDRTTPLSAVVPPRSSKVLMHAEPIQRTKPFVPRYSYSWSLGDYSQVQQPIGQYQFPFSDKIDAYASLSGSSANAYGRNTVLFWIPSGSKVLAARKGKVVLVKPRDRVEILHDDATLAAYRHLASITDGVTPGQTVTAGQVIGTARVGEGGTEAFVQLTVWRPEPTAIPGDLGFTAVSLPMAFCRAGGGCQTLTSSQMISGTKVAGKSKSKAKGKAK
jgi:hypothetical protein